MQLTLAHIGAQRSNGAAGVGLKPQYDSLTRVYLDRTTQFLPCQDRAFASEADFMTWLGRPNKNSRAPAIPVLLDSRGRLLSSTEFATWIGARRDQGTQHLAFAIGPADGWSPAALDLARGQSGLLLSFGPITMAHALARLVLAEQLYRACTILSGHPYHSAH